jgi:hypothetical protein
MTINIKLIGSLVNLLTPVAFRLKNWVYSGGNFNTKRALILIVCGCLLGSSVHFVGYEQTEQLIEIVDDVSDVIVHTRSDTSDEMN